MPIFSSFLSLALYWAAYIKVAFKRKKKEKGKRKKKEKALGKKKPRRARRIDAVPRTDL
jgi:hypothetical protein